MRPSHFPAPNHASSSDRTVSTSVSSPMPLGTPTMETDASDLPAGAYVVATVDGKQQLLIIPPPSPLR